MLYAVDREIFARTNIRLLNFHIVLFSSPQHTGSVASFVLFDNFRRRRVPAKKNLRRKFPDLRYLFIKKTVPSHRMFPY